MSDEKDTNQQESKSSIITISEFIEQDRILSAKNKTKPKSVSLLEWLEMAKNDPSLAQLAHETVFKAVTAEGYEEINHATDPRRAMLLELDQDYTLRIPKLLKDFLGIEESIADFDNFLYMAAGQGEASRQMLFMYGPPGGGKSTLASVIRKILEKHGFWQLEGCAHHDNPINVIPRHIRKELQDKFGLYIDPRSDICAQCRDRLIKEFDHDYTRFNAEWLNFSQRKGCGIAVVPEVDSVNFNMAVFIGEEDISLLGVHKRGDPKTFVMSGSASRGNRGWGEYVEVFKNPIEAQRHLITLLQEKYVPLPKLAGQIYVDTVVVGHTNEEEWTRFRDEKSNEAIVDRLYVTKIPYNLRLTEEMQIYKDSFLGKSLSFGNIHIDPHSLEQVAMFILSTRLSPHERIDILSKIKIYDGQNIYNNIGELRSIYSELRKSASRLEGFRGLSYRTAMKDIIENSLAYYRQTWEKDPYLREHGGYLNPLWIRKSLINYVEKLDIPADGDWPAPSKKRWLAFIQDDLHREFLRSVEEDLIKATAAGLGISLTGKAESLFRAYVINAIAFDFSSPYDSNLIKSIEDHLDLSGTSAKEAFRREVARAVMELRGRGEHYDINSSEALKKAIEATVRKPLLKDIAGAIREKKRREKIISEMEKMGYARMGIKHILRYMDTLINRD